MATILSQEQTNDLRAACQTLREFQAIFRDFKTI